MAEKLLEAIAPRGRWWLVGRQWWFGRLSALEGAGHCAWALCVVP